MPAWFPNRRLGFFLIFLACVFAMSVALYAQYVEMLNPCPLCILQRIGVIAVGIIALITAIVGSKSKLHYWLCSLMSLCALAGAGVSARQVWLQNLPLDQVPMCGPGLEYMLETMPLWHVLSTVLEGTGDCANVDWQVFGQSMAFWTGIFFISVTIFAWIVSLRKSH